MNVEGICHHCSVSFSGTVSMCLRCYTASFSSPFIPSPVVLWGGVVSCIVWRGFVFWGQTYKKGLEPEQQTHLATTAQHNISFYFTDLERSYDAAPLAQITLLTVSGQETRKRGLWSGLPFFSLCILGNEEGKGGKQIGNMALYTFKSTTSTCFTKFLNVFLIA